MSTADAGRGQARGTRALGSLCGAVAVSQVGDWLLFIALPLVVLRSSGSALATSMVFLAELIPAVVVGTICGPLIDRRDPGRLLILLTVTQTLVVAPLMWAGPGRVWLIYAVAGVQAAFTSLTLPTQQAIVPMLFCTDDAARVNGLVITASNGARLIGSPLGGALLPLLGLHGLVVGDLASFMISAVLLAPLARGRTTARTDASDGAGSFRAVMSGLRTVRSNRTLRAALGISFLSAVAQGLFLVMFVLFVVRLLHGGDGLVGLLRGVQAIGGLLGGLLVASRMRNASAHALTTGGLAAFALISALSWNSPSFTTAAWWYVVLFIAVGVPATILQAGLITGTQQASPPQLRGRTLSLLGVAEAIGQATGILAAGLLPSVASLTVILNAQAGCYAACAVIAAAAFGVTRTGNEKVTPVS